MKETENLNKAGIRASKAGELLRDALLKPHFRLVQLGLLVAYARLSREQREN